jgi:hypothetical protein
MFEKLGVVTNVWAERLVRGDRFEDLARQFGDNGFKHMEVRDGDYLRNSAFGSLIQEIESAMESCTDDQWKGICETMWRDGEGANQAGEKIGIPAVSAQCAIAVSRSPIHWRNQFAGSDCEFEAISIAVAELPNGLRR